MNPEKLVLMVCEDCNFNCQYCYQRKEKKRMRWETAEKILNFFFDLKTDNRSLYFLGGEPLLNFKLIEDIVGYLEEFKTKNKKKIKYHISTNGSLITDEILDFFDQHHFTIELSFDGLAQEVGRKKGSFPQLVQTLNKLKKTPNIKLLVNSVFYPRTVKYLSESIRFILDLGIPHISLGLALDNPWDDTSIEMFEHEVKRLMDVLFNHTRLTGNQPLQFFPDLNKKGIWRCSAGQNQLAVSAEGELWGCALFYEYFKQKKNCKQYRDFFFGTIDEFIQNHKKKYAEIAGNYRQLSQDNFYSEISRCFLCPEVKKCGVCPITSAFCHDNLEKIPAHVCHINRIAIREKEKFQRQLENVERQAN